VGQCNPRPTTATPFDRSPCCVLAGPYASLPYSLAVHLINYIPMRPIKDIEPPQKLHSNQLGPMAKWLDWCSLVPVTSTSTTHSQGAPNVCWRVLETLYSHSRAVHPSTASLQNRARTANSSCSCAAVRWDPWHGGCSASASGAETGPTEASLSGAPHHVLKSPETSTFTAEQCSQCIPASSANHPTRCIAVSQGPWQGGWSGAASSSQRRPVPTPCQEHSFVLPLQKHMPSPVHPHKIQQGQPPPPVAAQQIAWTPGKEGWLPHTPSLAPCSPSPLVRSPLLFTDLSKTYRWANALFPPYSTMH
jgi:hypothetical protein